VQESDVITIVYVLWLFLCLYQEVNLVQVSFEHLKTCLNPPS